MKNIEVFISIFIAITVLTNTTKCFGQDTVCYKNIPFSWCPHGWTLYKTSKRATRGTYYLHGACDDGQYWFRKGAFTENKRKISFGPANTFSFRRYFGSGNKDSAAGVPIDTNWSRLEVYLKRGDTLVSEDRMYHTYQFLRSK